MIKRSSFIYNDKLFLLSHMEYHNHLLCRYNILVMSHRIEEPNKNTLYRPNKPRFIAASNKFSHLSHNF